MSVNPSGLGPSHQAVVRVKKWFVILKAQTLKGLNAYCSTLHIPGWTGILQKNWGKRVEKRPKNGQFAWITTNSDSKFAGIPAKSWKSSCLIQRIFLILRPTNRVIKSSWQQNTTIEIPDLWKMTEKYHNWYTRPWNDKPSELKNLQKVLHAQNLRKNVDTKKLHNYWK